MPTQQFNQSRGIPEYKQKEEGEDEEGVSTLSFWQMTAVVMVPLMFLIREMTSLSSSRPCELGSARWNCSINQLSTS